MAFKKEPNEKYRNKNKIAEMKNSLNRLFRNLDTTEEDRKIEMIQSEAQKEKVLGKKGKKTNNASVNL